MSSGLKSLRREIGAEPNAWLSGPDETWLLTRTPSTKISGLLPSERLAAAANADLRTRADLSRTSA